MLDNNLFPDKLAPKMSEVSRELSSSVRVQQVDWSDRAIGEFSDLAARESLLRALLLAASLITLILSAPLWLSSRGYPLLPIKEWIPVLARPWDRYVFGGSLLFLIFAFWKYRLSIAGFLLISVFLVLQDQNRWQPWFYLYCVMLLLSLLPRDSALAANRVAISAVYFWAGVYKCNAKFYEEIVPFFLGSIPGWLPGFLLPLAKLALSMTPILEVFIALGVWVPRWRLASLATACGIHVAALALLGPSGHNFNAVVWPWNLVMPALLLLLFYDCQVESPWAALRKPIWGGIVVAFFLFLPILGIYGLLDSYLSFSVYSGATDRANILISPAMKERLPEAMQRFIQPAQTGSPARAGGPLLFDFRNWAESEIKVPPIPEARSYRAVARYLCSWVVDPNDLQLVLETRTGKRSFYRAQDLTGLKGEQ